MQQRACISNDFYKKKRVGFTWNKEIIQKVANTTMESLYKMSKMGLIFEEINSG